MQVSFTAHTPAHSPLTIQQRLEAAGRNKTRMSTPSATPWNPSPAPTRKPSKPTRKANNSWKHATAASTP